MEKSLLIEWCLEFKNTHCPWSFHNLTEGDRGGKKNWCTWPTSLLSSKEQKDCFKDHPATWVDRGSPSLAPRSRGNACSLPISALRTPSQILCLSTISSLSHFLSFGSYSLHRLKAPQCLLSPPKQVSLLTYFFLLLKVQFFEQLLHQRGYLKWPPSPAKSPSLSLSLKWLRHKSPLSISLMAHYPLNP